MRRAMCGFLAVVLGVALMLSGGGRAAAAPLQDVPPFSINAESALLLEAGTGQVLFEKNADLARPTASLVKTMTLLIVLNEVAEERLALDEMVSVSKTAAATPGSQAFLDAGASYSVSDLLRCVVIASANDAAVALAERICGSESAFVEKMNERAAEMGLTGSAFKTCTGLPADGQHMNARDVAALSLALLEQEAYHTWATTWMDTLTHPSGRRTELVNTNRLVRTYEGADGVKTGSTAEAGYCVSASATKNGMRLIAVVLGSPSGKARFDAAGQMLDYGFDHYGVRVLVKAGEVIAAEVPVARGDKKSVDLVAQSDFSLLTRKGEQAEVTLQYEAPELLAPLAAGQAVGEARVLRGGRDVGGVAVAPAQDVGAPGLLSGVYRVLRHWYLN